MEILRAAKFYAAADDLAIVTSYFNPSGYKTKIDNYWRFRNAIERSGLYLLTIELAFEDQPFSLEGSPFCPVLQIRARDVLWQKERLLNVAFASLPNCFTKTAWLDCDILFVDPFWTARVSKLLDQYALLQPFRSVVRLPRGVDAYYGQGIAYASFAAVYQEDQLAHLQGTFGPHGHTGFAWAARRELLANTGLYDACIAGSGDHMIAHAACGDWTSPCVQRDVGRGPWQLNHFRNWAMRFYSATNGRLGCATGTVLHLWHGDIENRKYADRHRELAEFGFDPSVDIAVSRSGAWKWASVKPDLHGWAKRYFDLRAEDGPGGVV